jgi:hypothetical protein
MRVKIHSLVTGKKIRSNSQKVEPQIIIKCGLTSKRNLQHWPKIVQTFVEINYKKQRKVQNNI